jgi:hypothetical protein
MGTLVQDEDCFKAMRDSLCVSQEIVDIVSDKLDKMALATCRGCDSCSLCTDLEKVMALFFSVEHCIIVADYYERYAKNLLKWEKRRKRPITKKMMDRHNELLDYSQECMEKYQAEWFKMNWKRMAELCGMKDSVQWKTEKTATFMKFFQKNL